MDRDLIKSLEKRIQCLESENLRLRRIIESAPNAVTSGVQSVAASSQDILMRNAMERVRGGKWKEAALIIQREYGIDFMVRKSNNFKNLKSKMLEYFEMPPAPNRKDKSPIAEELRQKRKNIRSTVYTYIERMGDYLMQDFERRI